MVMSFLHGTWRCLFLVCPWPRPGLQGLNITLKMPYSLQTRNVILNVAPGQALYILDICPENRDESNGNNILRLWLQFIPIFGALHSKLRKGHTTKKDISMVLAIASFLGDSAESFLEGRHIGGRNTSSILSRRY